jgi:Protein of unknown function (DUF1572)
MTTTLAADLAALLDRDLGLLEGEIRAYPDDDSVWRIAGTIKNSAGTLTLHLVGNLDFYVGSVLGGSGYVRDRDAEFADRGVPRPEMLARVERCRRTVAKTLATVSDDTMLSVWPDELPARFQGWSVHRFLTHLAGHFNWHLGQINYHRRLLAEGTAV